MKHRFLWLVVFMFSSQLSYSNFNKRDYAEAYIAALLRVGTPSLESLINFLSPAPDLSSSSSSSVQSSIEEEISPEDEEAMFELSFMLQEGFYAIPVIYLTVPAYSVELQQWTQGPTATYELTEEQWNFLRGQVPIAFDTLSTYRHPDGISSHFITSPPRISSQMAYFLAQCAFGNKEAVQNFLTSLDSMKKCRFVNEAYALGISHFLKIQKSTLLLSSGAYPKKVKERKRKRKRTGFTPENGNKRRCLSITSPTSKALKIRAHLNGKQITCIDSKISDFRSGVFTFLELFDPAASFAVDADHEIFKQLADKFFLENYELITGDDESKEQKIFRKLSDFIHKNIQKLHSIIIQSDEEDLKPVCKHFSMYTAILFSKISSLYELFDTDYDIKFFTGYMLEVSEGRWHFSKGHHAWTVVTKRTKNSETGKIEEDVWYYDAFNYAFAKICSDLFVKGRTNIKIFSNRHGPLTRQSLELENFHYPYIEMSVDKVFHARNPDSLYYPSHKENLHNIILDCLADCSRKERITPKRKFVIERIQNIFLWDDEGSENRDNECD